ncbi:hypothetical protein [Helicobacter sp. 10-6591]|uniref:hypothetical protein n=1 Tax=Helicobacter sp. 10-6591 TaxID=2004998 RepID=UPI0015EB89A8|nr:hypothetical protein [Helicobacter sp. 10-6591]
MRLVFFLQLCLSAIFLNACTKQKILVHTIECESICTKNTCKQQCISTNGHRYKK